MAITRKFQFSRSRGMQTIQRHLDDLLRDHLIWNTSGQIAGRSTVVEKRECLNFGSCSYLGLHARPELIEGTVDAVRRFGTQFPFSRAYLSSDLYEELEVLLERMTGRHVLVASSTTLAHLSALPVLVDDDDAVIIDQFAHASMFMATELLGTSAVVRARHSRLDKVSDLIEALSPKHKRVWFVLDGLYSMRGDFAPFDGLRELLDRYPKLHLYVDDAHSTSWFGQNGRGAALTHLPKDDRVVVALSLNKAFSAAGGALVVSNPELKRKLRACGGTMSFSGPIQAPMLGAAVASAKLHLTPELGRLQAEVLEKVRFARRLASDLGVEVIADDDTPIFMLPYDAAEDARAATRAFWEAGFYVCPVTFPAVPISNPGIRFTVCHTNEVDDIGAFLTTARRLQAPQKTRATRPSEAGKELPDLTSM